jgi:hypothetical protein
MPWHLWVKSKTCWKASDPEPSRQAPDLVIDSRRADSCLRFSNFSTRYSRIAEQSPPGNDRFQLRIQPVDATQALNLSARTPKSNVYPGRSLSWRATNCLVAGMKSYSLHPLYLPFFVRPNLHSYPLFVPVIWQVGWQKHHGRPG